MSDHRLEIVLAAKDITGKAFTKLQGRMTALMKSFVSFRGAAIAAAGAAGIGMLIKSSLDAADQIGKTADKLGISTDALQQYQFAASQSGVATKTMEMGLQRFTRRMAEAAQGKGVLKAVLEQYNITLKDTAGNTRKSADVLEDLADVIKHTEDPAERLRIAFSAFDSEGVAMINTMKNGSQGLNAWGKEARDLGIIMDKDLIRASEKANDELDKLSKVIGVNFHTAVVTVAPEITKIAEESNNWVKANQELIKQKIPVYLDNIATAVSAIATASGYAFTAYTKLLDTTGIGHVIDLYKELVELNRLAAPIDNRPAGVMDFDAQDAAINSYKESITQTVNETNLLVAATNKVTEATMAEAEAMAAVYQQQFDVTVASYTQGFVDMAEAEAEAAKEMANFQQQIDEMNGIMSNTSTWDLMQDQMNNIGDGIKNMTDKATIAVERLSDRIAGDLASSLTDVVTGAKTAKEAMADFAKSTIRWIMEMIMKQMILNAMSSIFGGFGNAQGNVYDQTGMVPFARGGVVNRPTVFPFASGVGVMGEAGPEAILPLTRTSGGDLGVKTEGGSGGGHIITINAVDAKSFDDMLKRNPSRIVKIIDNALVSNTSLRTTIRRTL